MKEVQLDRLPNWLQDNLGKKLEAFKRDGQKSRDKIAELINDLKDAFQRLGSKDERGISELAMKAANRFVEKVTPLIENFGIPNEITYNNLETLQYNLEKVLKTITEHGQKWVPKMAPHYKAEIAEIDIYLKKLGGEYQELQKLLAKKHLHIKDYYSIFSIIEEIQKEQKIAKELLQQKSKLSETLTKFEKDKEAKHSELKEIKEAALVRNITDVEKELKQVEETILRELRSLEKPFRKLEKLVADGTVSISGEQRQTLRNYLDTPLNTFLSEDQNCSQLKSLLTRLNEILAAEMLDLKGSRQKKAMEQISRIFKEDTLPPLKKKYEELASEKDKLTIRINEKGLTQKQKHLETIMEELNQKREDLNTEISRIEAEHQKSTNRIESHIKKLEQKIDKLTGNNIKIIASNTTET